MIAYYNEFDPHAAARLENLIADGLIAPGVVDTRSILDVTPSDLSGFTQCHFFAGIGGWSLALRLAGVPDSAPVWTGSCPCQPFSSAGKGGGFADERHLWPAWHYLIEQCSPKIVYGEQVASKDGLAWLDLVYADMEGTGYAFWDADICAAGVGSPNIRQRQWFVGERLEHAARHGRKQRWPEPSQWSIERRRSFGGLDRTDCERRTGRQISADRSVDHRHDAGRSQGEYGPSRSDEGRALRLADSSGNGWERRLPGRQDAEREALDRPARCNGTVERLADLSRRGEPGGIRELQSTEWPSEPSGGHGTLSQLVDSDRDGRVARRARREAMGQGHSSDPASAAGRVAHTDGGYASAERQQRGWEQRQQPEDSVHSVVELSGRPGPTNGIWRHADWLFCRDDRWRPIESGTFPLVDGLSFRVGSGSAFEGKDRAGMLKGYGNAINPWVAAEVIAAHQASRSVSKRRRRDLTELLG